MATKELPPKSPRAYSREVEAAQEELQFFKGFAKLIVSWWDLERSDTAEYWQMRKEVMLSLDKGVLLLRSYGGGTVLLSYGQGTLVIDGVPVADWILDPQVARSESGSRLSNDDVLGQMKLELALARLENRVRTLQAGKQENLLAWWLSLVPGLIRGAWTGFVGLSRFLQVLLTTATTVVTTVVIAVFGSGIWTVIQTLIPYWFNTPPAP